MPIRKRKKKRIKKTAELSPSGRGRSIGFKPSGVLEFGAVVAETEALSGTAVVMDHDIAVHRFVGGRTAPSSQGGAINPVGIGGDSIHRFLSGEGMIVG